jgi:peptidoglycan hydrolase-like protein with peptidoglycan-binding domain
MVTLSAASVTSSTGATLSGTVDPDGAATSYRFEYGTASVDGLYTASTTLQAGTGVESVSAQVAHLRPDTTYLFVLIATNALGRTVSPPQTFDTMQSSCAAERLVIASDEEAVGAAEDTLTADQATAGSTVTTDEQQLAADQQQLAADNQALALADVEVTNPGARFTALPAVGQRIARGQSVYSLDDRPVPLLYGSTTPYRALYLGVTPGPDVTELQDNLIALGFGTGLSADGIFGLSTELAVKAWQASLGVPVTGVVSLGSIVVEPGAVRVETVAASLGEAANAATAVFTASSTVRQVTIDLDAAQQSEVAVGDQVLITLPDNATTPGVVSYVGSVAAAATGSGAPGGSTGEPTITVYVTPTDPSATGGLDQAPVEVAITTQSIANALVVPVDALLALSGGGYAVEEDTHGVRHLVAVSLGIFDDADGIVQVTGAGLAVGQQVVVPAL